MSDLNWNKLPWRKSSFSSDSANCVEVAWRTSSFCHQDSCVEVGWTASSRCAGGDCVQVRHESDVVYVRDSKLGEDSPVQEWPLTYWEFLCDAIVADLPRFSGFRKLGDGGVELRWAHIHPAPLIFDAGEWKAFVLGVRAGEFDPATLSEGVTAEPPSGGSDRAATGTAEQGCGAVPVAAESSPPDDWFARQLDADCASIDTPADRLAGRGSLLPASTPDDPRSGGQPGPYVAEITWSEDPSLGEPQGSPVGRPVDASTDEVTLSSAVQPGSDAAGTGVPPDPVPAAPLDDVLAEVAEERVRQAVKHGDQSHLPNGTGPALILRDLPQYQSASRADHLAVWAKARCKAASQNEGGDGSITFEHILTEEWGEAIAESDPVKLRAELIQLAAVAVQWIQAIDRREWARAVAPLVSPDGAL
jgi:hypothetical protein